MVYNHAWSDVLSERVADCRGAGPALAGQIGWSFGLAVAWTGAQAAARSCRARRAPAFASIQTPSRRFAPPENTTGAPLASGPGLGMTFPSPGVCPTFEVDSAPPITASAGSPPWCSCPTLSPYSLPDTGKATVAAIQGNVPGDGTDVLFDHRQVTANHVALTVDLAERVASGEVEKPDFVVWPENSTAVDPFTDEGVNAAITTASAAIDTPILVGGIAQGPQPDQVLNQGIVWLPGTGGGDRYSKQHPVPYGEYIPWRDQSPFTATFGQLR